MTRTRRIYNKKPIIGTNRFKGWISSQKLTAEDIALKVEENGLYFAPWIGYHPHRQFDDISPLEPWGNSRGGYHFWFRKRVLPIWNKRNKENLKRYMNFEVENYFENPS